MKSILVYLLLSFMLVFSNSTKPRIWRRIPKYVVDQRVMRFLNSNQITNCFEYRETQTNLLLKCWRNNKLTDISIEINPGKKQYRYIGDIVSV